MHQTRQMRSLEQVRHLARAWVVHVSDPGGRVRTEACVLEVTHPVTGGGVERSRETRVLSGGSVIPGQGCVQGQESQASFLRGVVRPVASAPQYFERFVKSPHPNICFY